MVKIVLNGWFQRPKSIQILQFFIEYLLTRFYRHSEATLLKVLPDLALEGLMVFAYSLHKLLEQFVSCGALLVWIHHVQKTFLVLIFLNKFGPSAFMVDGTIFHFSHEHLSEILPIFLFFDLFFSMLFLLMFLLLLQNVLSELCQSINIM